MRYVKEGINNGIRETEEANKKNEKLPTVLICKDVNRNILSDKIQVLQRWKEYFLALLNNEELLESEYQHLDLRGNDIKEDTLPPTNAEINSIINKLRNNKVLSPDKINAELIEKGRTTVERKTP
jgi:hypothetical protein